MDKKYYKAIVKYIVQQPGNYQLKETVKLIGADTVAELAVKAPGRHFYIPSNKTMMHWLCVMYVKKHFKSMDEFKTQEGREKAKSIAKLFGIKPYQIKKILAKGKFTR